MSCILDCLSWILPIIVGSLAWYLYQPLPPDLADRSKKRILLAFIKLLTLMGILREKLGYGSRQLGFRFFEKTRYVPSPITENDVQFYDTNIGKDRILVRIYDSQPQKAGERRPAVVYYHGGGWAIGSVESYHLLTLRLASRAECLVFSVEYRRAPEHPYPTPLDDCIAAAKHVFESADKYNVDTSRVAIMGDSAGGNLAAAVCLKLRDTKYEYQPKLQVLIYPVVQMLDLQLPSYRNPYHLLIDPDKMSAFITFYTGLKGINTSQLASNEHVSRELKQKYADLIDLLPPEFRKGYKMYAMKGDPDLCDKYEKFVTDPYFAPLMAESLKDLPEAYVWTAGYDALRDEGIMFANKLKRDGVPVTWVNKAEAMHGDFGFKVPAGRIYRREIFDFIGQKL